MSGSMIRNVSFWNTEYVNTEYDISIYECFISHTFGVVLNVAVHFAKIYSFGVAKVLD